MERKELKELLEPYDSPRLECDGSVRVFGWLLKQKHISYVINFGQLEVGHKKLWPHYWIELDNGLIIDYKARMWLGDEPNIPHGIFKLDEFPKALYVGKESKELLVCKSVFDILTRLNDLE